MIKKKIQGWFGLATPNGNAGLSVYEHFYNPLTQYEKLLKQGGANFLVCHK